MPETARFSRPDPRRILFVATSENALRDVPSWEASSVWWPWSVALVGEPGGPPPGIPVAQIVARRLDGWRSSVRAVPTLARTVVLAVRAGAPPRAVWALKRSRELRDALRDVDVVWGIDPAADAALSTVRGLLGERPVLGSAEWAAGRASVANLEAALSRLLDDPHLSAVEGVDPDRVPTAIRPLDAAVDAYHRCRRSHGLLESQAWIRRLDLLGWPSSDRLASGSAALAAAADLSLGLLDGEDADDAELAGIVEGTLAGADAALAAGLPSRALARLGDAMALTFHRARHSEVSRSPLVEDPRDFLGPLARSTTFRSLVPATGRELGPPEPPHQARSKALPRVLIVTGAYGHFHRGVVAALSGSAEVKIRDYTKKHPHLGRKILEPTTLPRMAALLSSVGRGAQAFEGEIEEELRREAEETRTTITPMLGWADVVFCDWADAATAWVSHVCPPGVRLVVRIHALDALDPWLHLTAWDRVEQVVVVSEPMRSLVVALLGARGVEVPVHIIRHAVPHLPDLALEKEVTARTTLGMIGWGRRVKDPLWALDLLERDPSWELVLIGPDFPESPGPMTEPYVTRLRERLQSPGLRGRVHVVGATTDIAEPLRRIGVILSSSLRESWHIGLVEGAGSGAVPVVRDWPMLAARGGPRTIFPHEWVVSDLDEAEARVRRVTAEDAWPRESTRARQQALTFFDPEDVAADYRELVLRGRPPTLGMTPDTGAR